MADITYDDGTGTSKTTGLNQLTYDDTLGGYNTNVLNTYTITNISFMNNGGMPLTLIEKQ